MKPRHQGQGLDRRHGESGSLVIMTALVLPIVMLIVFGAIDIAHAVYVQRHLQKIADMAAIAGAEDIGNADTTAQQNAIANGFSTTAPGRAITVSTGNWNPQKNKKDKPTYFVPNGSQTNAVQVKVRQEVPYFLFLGPPLTLHAQAIAYQPRAAGISIGSKFLTIDSKKSALLNGILGGLLGTRLDLTAVGYQGLANTNINLGQLAQNLGVGTVNGLLTTNLSLPQLYQGALNVLSNQASGGILNGHPNAQGALSDLIGSIPATQAANIQLSNIINLGLATPQAAVNAQVNLLQLISASAMLANGHHFVDTGLNVLNIAKLRLKVISPPKLAYGEPGHVYNSEGHLVLNKELQPEYRTVAKTAQVALQLQVLGTLANVQILASPAEADLTSVTCRATPSQNKVQVRAGTAILAADATLLANPAPLTPVAPENFQIVTFKGLPTQSHSIGSTSNGDQPINLAVNVLGLVKLNLGTLLSPVIDLLAKVLPLLGISLGTAHVGYNAIGCDNPVLVY